MLENPIIIVRSGKYLCVLVHFGLSMDHKRTREFHNKVPPDKMPLLCRKFCVINKPFTENIVYFCL